jgi:hypothetical protein
MKRFGLVLLTVLAAGSAVASATTAPPRARLRALVCVHALDPVARAVSVTAVMRPLPGTRKLALRFALQTKSRRGGSFTAVTGGDLAKWISPANPTLGQLPGDVWRLNKQVIDLAAPAAYRFRVSFRWTGAHHRVLGTAVRVSATCFQPERRPDLLVARIGVQLIPSNPQLNRYVATISNGGATAAGPFDVQFATAGSPQANFTVQRLRTGASVREKFVGPACSAAAPVTVTADPFHQVDDYNRTNNVLTAVCPA